MSWVGIGRCWWSGYGYKFEGKCWAPVWSSWDRNTFFRPQPSEKQTTEDRCNTQPRSTIWAPLNHLHTCRRSLWLAANTETLNPKAQWCCKLKELHFKVTGTFKIYKAQSLRGGLEVHSSVLRSMISVWDDTLGNPWDLLYLTYMYTDRCSFQMNIFSKFTIRNLSKHLLNWHCKTQMLPHAIWPCIHIISAPSTVSLSLYWGEYSKSTSSLELPKTRNTHNHMGRNSSTWKGNPRSEVVT